MKRILVGAIVGSLCLICSPLFAHPHHPHIPTPGSSALAGLLHPVFGIDHLLAMVAIGLLSAQIGGRALWALPATFVASMIAGGWFGFAGVGLPAVETGIALSVVALGAALAANQKFPIALPLVAVAAFGGLHGHAHGTEMPSLANPALYALGFVVATIGLHAAGVGAGCFAVRSIRGARILRFSGALIAAAGVMVLVSQS